MSTLVIKIQKITEINEHPNADRLEIATIGGWQSVVKKDSFRDRDLRNIRQKLYEKFGGNMDVTITFTNSITQTKNKKTPIFIQNIQGLRQ